MRYGRSLRNHWHLAEDASFLNHGSFGACPKAVLSEQARIRHTMESQPDLFFRSGVMPDHGATLLREAAGRLGAFVNAGEDGIAFAENASLAVQGVLRSVALAPGDVVLTTDHTYNAVRLMVEARCAETGAVPRVVALPIPAAGRLSGEEVATRILEAVTPATRLAILDHITSPTALEMPLTRLIPALQEKGVKVLVDAAHAVGQVQVDLAALGADWYTSNAHKWLWAPKGSAFLHASRQAAPVTRPNLISHFIDMGFPRSFDFVGTRDYSGWLAIGAALDFHQELGPDAHAYRQRLLGLAAELLGKLGAIGVQVEGTAPAMRSFALPQQRPATPEDARQLVRTLWDRERIQAMAVAFQGRLLLRISAQVYVGEEDLRDLHGALERHGWLGR